MKNKKRTPKQLEKLILRVEEAIGFSVDFSRDKRELQAMLNDLIEEQNAAQEGGR